VVTPSRAALAIALIGALWSAMLHAQGRARGGSALELSERNVAIVGGERVAFDGEAEGLAWPALGKTFAGRDKGERVVLSVSRTVPVVDVLRAAWTLRGWDLAIETLDANGQPATLELRARRAAPTPSATREAARACHLAVFVAKNHELSIATAAGPQRMSGEDALPRFVHALDDARTQCRIRFVAFGAESKDQSWASVFDVALGVQRAGAAGDARFVLGEPM
jgi:hypothetical protein